MLYSKQLTNELTQLINQKNQSSFVNGDLTFDFLSRQPNGDMTVSVTASPGVAYYGEQELTYTRRSLTNALKGVPVKLVVGGSADMRELLGMFATKYGFEFDTAVDFLQSELDKTIDFSESGLVAVTLPAADTSNIWIGELSITVSNDALDLDAIIKVAQMTSFAYLQEDAAKGSLDLATWPIRHVHPDLPMKKGVNYISQSLVQALLANMVADGNVKQEDADAIYAAMAFTGNNNTVMFNVMEDTSVTPSMFFSYLFSTTTEPFDTPNFAGLPWVWYESTTEQIQYVLRNQGASTVTLKLTGWNDINVAWGDGSPVETEGTTFTHTFADDKEYIIVATGTPDPLLSYSKQSIRGFGIVQIDAWNNGLKYSPETNNLQRLTKVPSSLPATWVALDNLFAYAITFNGPEVLSWNTSNIGSMAGLFTGASKFNQPIEIWDVSNVTDMNFMFNSATSFNQPLNQWNVGNVRDFSFALSSAFAFNQSLDKWDVSKATTLSSMFSNTKVFDQDISGWDVSKVTTMVNMFSGAIFNQDISAWQTTSLKQIDYLMRNNKVFNQDLSGWNVSAITSGLDTVGDGATAWVAEYKPGYVNQ